jgi:hypothetical protein
MTGEGKGRDIQVNTAMPVSEAVQSREGEEIEHGIKRRIYRFIW